MTTTWRDSWNTHGDAGVCSGMKHAIRAATCALLAFVVMPMSARTKTISVSEQTATSHIKTWIDAPLLGCRTRLAGPVRIRVVLAKTGEIQQIRALSGHPMLIARTINSVQQWQFEPFLQKGKHVQARFDLTVRYENNRMLPPSPMAKEVKAQLE